MEDDKRLDRLESKLDKIVDSIGDIKATSAAQHVTLVEHTRRSTLAEENIALLRDEVKPIQKQVAMVHGALKLVGLLATLAAIAELVLKLL